MEQSKISIVSLHLESVALQWHKNFLKLKNRTPSWGEYVKALRSRFGFAAYEDPMAELKKLKQTGPLQEYVKAFEMLLDRAQLGEEQALSCFLAGLKHEMEMMVRMFNPKTLQEAYSLAKLQEAARQGPFCGSSGGSKGFYNKNPGGIMMNSFAKNNTPVISNVAVDHRKNVRPMGAEKRSLNLTPKQMEEKRSKNLCFWCDERFTPGHRCKNRQLYMLTIQDDEGELENSNEMLKEEEEEKKREEKEKKRKRKKLREKKSFKFYSYPSVYNPFSFIDFN